LKGEGERGLIHTYPHVVPRRMCPAPLFAHAHALVHEERSHVSRAHDAAVLSLPRAFGLAEPVQPATDDHAAPAVADDDNVVAGPDCGHDGGAQGGDVCGEVARWRRVADAGHLPRVRCVAEGGEGGYEGGEVEGGVPRAGDEDDLGLGHGVGRKGCLGDVGL
jgi:hypothetical protein